MPLPQRLYGTRASKFPEKTLNFPQFLPVTEIMVPDKSPFTFPEGRLLLLWP